jgi:MoaA/NifB/PqqE/SkfB family radical SAM enzyme
MRAAFQMLLQRRHDWALGEMRLRRRLYGILRAIEVQVRAGDLAGTARALDAAKPRVFEILRKTLRDAVAAKALTVKLLNLCLARHHFLARSTEVLSLPPGLVVDPSNACNLACPGCVHSARAKELRLFDWKPGILPENCFTAFLRRYGATAIQATLCNYGEPLVNPETPKLIRAAKRYLLHTTISTNMTLPRFDAEAYVESGLEYMIVSIDGATQAVYERFRRKGDLERAYENLRKLIAARERLGRRTPIVAWRFLAFEHNVHEIPAAMEKARELGLDQFRADPAWDIGWDDPAIRPASIQPVREDFRADLPEVMAASWNPFPAELDEESIERDFERKWSEDAKADTVSRSGESCEWLYKSITMDAGARIFPCCCAPTSRKDLHFSTFDRAAPGDSFNSEKHKLARLFFLDPARYREEYGSSRPEANPYCVRCEWDKSADPNPAQIRNYFRASAPGLFDARTLDLLVW